MHERDLHPDAGVHHRSQHQSRPVDGEAVPLAHPQLPGKRLAMARPPNLSRWALYYPLISILETFDSYAALFRRRRERALPRIEAQRVSGTLDQRQVHSADELSMSFRQWLVRAVLQHQRSVRHNRRVSVVAQRVHQRRPARGRQRATAHRTRDRCARFACRGECGLARPPAAIYDRAREQERQ